MSDREMQRSGLKKIKSVEIFYTNLNLFQGSFKGKIIKKDKA